MKRSLREWLIRIVILMIGLSVAHLGVTLFLLTDLGSDPFNVLIQGLFRTLSSLTGWAFLSHGRVHVAVSLLIILILLLTDDHRFLHPAAGIAFSEDAGSACQNSGSGCRLCDSCLRHDDRDQIRCWDRSQ